MVSKHYCYPDSLAEEACVLSKQYRQLSNFFNRETGRSHDCRPIKPLTPTISTPSLWQALQGTVRYRTHLQFLFTCHHFLMMNTYIIHTVQCVIISWTYVYCMLHILYILSSVCIKKCKHFCTFLSLYYGPLCNFIDFFPPYRRLF